MFCAVGVVCACVWCGGIDIRGGDGIRLRPCMDRGLTSLSTSRVVNPKFWAVLQDRRLDTHGNDLDCGWAKIQKTLLTNFKRREGIEDDERDPTRIRQATTKKTRKMMETRERLMVQNAAKKRPALAVERGKQPEYMMVFKKEKRERVHVHEQMEFAFRECNPLEVPKDFITNSEWLGLGRRLPFSQEQLAHQDHSEMLKNFDERLLQIRKDFPRGQEISERMHADNVQEHENRDEGVRFY